MRHVLRRLHPPRPSFVAEMSPEELEPTGRHAANCLMEREIGFGPVADPAGSWGLGLIEADDEAAVAAIAADDPVASGAGFRYEAVPMPRIMLRSELARVSAPSS